MVYNRWVVAVLENLEGCTMNVSGFLGFFFLLFNIGRCCFFFSLSLLILSACVRACVLFFYLTRLFTWSFIRRGKTRAVHLHTFLYFFNLYLYVFFKIFFYNFFFRHRAYISHAHRHTSWPRGRKSFVRSLFSYFHLFIFFLFCPCYAFLAVLSFSNGIFSEKSESTVAVTLLIFSLTSRTHFYTHFSPSLLIYI